MKPYTFEHIPEELRASHRWLVWRYGDKPLKNGKLPKLPYDLKNLNHSVDKREAAKYSFDEVRQAEGVSGIGLLSSGRLIGIDFDGCVENGKIIDERVLDIVSQLNSYTEVSPSQTGLRVWVLGEAPKAPQNSETNPLGINKLAVKTKLIEIYPDSPSSNYLTLTGWRLGSATSVRELDKDEVQWLYSLAKASASPAPQAPASRTQASGTGGKFTRLQRFNILSQGRWQELHASQSEADDELCKFLAEAYNGDEKKVEADFRASKLFRPASVKGGDYVGRTVRHAVSVWKANPKGKDVIRQVGKYALTDSGNSERLATVVQDRYRYCHDFGQWFHWNEKRWAPDQLDSVYLAARGMVRGMLSEATTIQSDAERTALLKWSLRCESRSAIENAISLCQSEEGVAAATSEFDQCPWLFNTMNGVLDLEDMGLRPHDRGLMLSKISPASYFADAECPTWVEVLETIIPDPEVREFLQRSVGYSLSGLCVEKQLWFLIGEAGDNGKTTFIEALRQLFGDEYSVNLNFSSLMPREGQGPSGDLARLRGARFVSACESDKGQRLSSALVKRLTGGGDRITASFKYKDEFEFVPTHKLWIATNHPPKLDADDNALWNRVFRIPFDVVVPKEKQDRHLLEKLKGEVDGILTWAVEGWKRYREDGLKVPASVLQATGAYRDEVDLVANFIEDACEVSGELMVKTDVFYRAFKQWVEATQGKRTWIPTARSVTENIKRHGFQIGEKSNGTRSVRGLRPRQGSQASLEESSSGFEL